MGGLGQPSRSIVISFYIVFLWWQAPEEGRFF